MYFRINIQIFRHEISHCQFPEKVFKYRQHTQWGIYMDKLKRPFDIWQQFRHQMNKPATKLLLLFGMEGIFFQFINSINAYSNSLYATHMGATDTQIGLIQTIPNLVAIALLLPFGALSDKAKSTKTIPILLLIIMGISYFLLGLVPALGTYRMVFYFIFLGLGIGILANYNAQWQVFFGSVTGAEERNNVYATRNRFMFFIGTLTPLLCGAAMSAMGTSEEKLQSLQIFYYLSGIFLLAQAFIIWKIPGGKKSPEELATIQPFRFSTLLEAAGFIFHNIPFRRFFLGIMLFYMTWHLDWSMWYLAEIQYIGMTEMHLAIFNALICIFQLLTIGIFARMNQKRSIHYTFLYGIGALCLCPLAVMTSTWMPLAIRPWFFIVFALFGNFPQSCIGLCTIQMLLDVLPEKNRSLVTSLYTIVITLSNSLLPLLGVKLYTWMGADYRALIIFNTFVFLLRSTTFVVFFRKYLHGKK